MHKSMSNFIIKISSRNGWKTLISSCEGDDPLLIELMESWVVCPIFPKFHLPCAIESFVKINRFYFVHIYSFSTSNIFCTTIKHPRHNTPMTNTSNICVEEGFFVDRYTWFFVSHTCIYICLMLSELFFCIAWWRISFTRFSSFSLAFRVWLSRWEIFKHKIVIVYENK